MTLSNFVTLFLKFPPRKTPCWRIGISPGALDTSYFWQTFFFKTPFKKSYSEDLASDPAYQDPSCFFTLFKREFWAPREILVGGTRHYFLFQKKRPFFGSFFLNFSKNCQNFTFAKKSIFCQFLELLLRATWHKKWVIFNFPEGGLAKTPLFLTFWQLLRNWPKSAKAEISIELPRALTGLWCLRQINGSKASRADQWVQGV